MYKKKVLDLMKNYGNFCYYLADEHKKQLNIFLQFTFDHFATLLNKTDLRGYLNLIRYYERVEKHLEAQDLADRIKSFLKKNKLNPIQSFGPNLLL